MKPIPPTDLLRKAQTWGRLSARERPEVGRELRRLGWSYGEIRELIPVAKGTLAYWCRDIVLSDAQAALIEHRRGAGSRLGTSVDTQRQRRIDIEQVRAGAGLFARSRLHDAFFVAGVTLYWSEGAKTMNRLAMSHSEPAALRLFIAWVGRYLIDSPQGAIRLNLHSNNDLDTAQLWWIQQLGWRECRVNKAFIKPDGTGHRRNHLRHGVCAVTIDRSTDAYHRTMAFVDALREESANTWTNLDPGR